MFSGPSRLGLGSHLRRSYEENESARLSIERLWQTVHENEKLEPSRSRSHRIQRLDSESIVQQAMGK